ncbi:unnamed protein product [Closterium sp. NIES-53]
MGATSPTTSESSAISNAKGITGGGKYFIVGHEGKKYALCGKGAASGGAKPAGAEPGDAESASAEPEGAEPGGAETKSVESRGAEPEGAEPGGVCTEQTTRAAAAVREAPAGAGATKPGAAGVTARAGGTGGAGGAGVTAGAGGTVQRRPFFVPPPPSSLPPPDSVLCQVLNSPLPAPSPYAEQIDSLTKHCEPESRPASPVRAVRTGRRVPRPFHPPVPGTHIMALRPSFVPLRVPLPSPPASSLADGPDLESDLVRAASPTVPCLLATVVTNPSFESVAASALVAELVDFAVARHLDYATTLVAEFESDCPPSVGGECALGTNVLEDRQEDFECLAAVVPHLVAMLLAPEGDSDAPDIPTPHSYVEAITVPTPLSGRHPWTQRWHPGSPRAPTSTQFPRLGRT